ncbi:uncharacterized protein LOC131038144 isoform X2 [Cryptomeria japonica]|uniref:uncharacterized protein LOC131038144 isoform X2 n=1 Tax=Cryptomeria japonica TaxID=3369 RepID=UPI0027DA7BC5|nr:uncharacterized protein LOC131038144 isoform X2 [Cryptomeria japonica]
MIYGSGMQQDSGFKSPPENMLACPRALMDRRLKPNGELALKCPRCDSPNTKFCYYNNYSLSQPRYFCKTCRRYWTKGGTLRNVPVGGGCRKNKRFKRAGDHPSQTDASGGLQNNSNEMNCSSSPIPEQSNQLNLPPPVRSVYFTLLNGGADGLGISYSSASVQQQHNLQALKVAAGADPDLGVLTDNCNSNASGSCSGSGTGMMMMIEVPSTSTCPSNPTASHEPLANLSNLNTFQSPPNLISPSGPEQHPQAPSLVQINGDLSTIFEAARHHHQNQQVPTSSAPTFSHVSSNSNRFNDVTGVNDHRLNSTLQDQDVQIQWHQQHKFTIPVEDHHDNGGAAQVLLPFDHENHHQVRPPHHDQIKLRHLNMDGVQTTPMTGGEVIEENGHATPYNWQLPTSEGLLDTSANNINYWNGTAGAWPDLSCYAPYTNPLI